MKHLILIPLLLCLSGVLLAADDPISAYLQEPSPAAFKLAAGHAAEAIQKNEAANRNKLYLAYIADLEASRLLDELVQTADSLAAGERFMLANILLGKEDFARAIEIYDSINRDLPNWSCPWRHKGEASFRLQDYEAAVLALEQAIATNTSHYDAYLWMALALKELGRYSAALSNLDSAMQLPLEAQTCEDEGLSQEDVQRLYQELQLKVQ
ncbi:MAG: hypothetical protein K0B87_09300 [Candidatus Syntrophosphaera sp.]|nr:hypothetical protein [Candidatus Syntrophosphaera sp.]